MDRAINKTGGGLGAYVENKYTVSDTELAHLNISNSDIELQCLTIKPKNLKKQIIINTYRPPKGNQTNFINLLLSTLDQLTDYKSNELYILGDFNIDLIKKNDINVLNLKSLTTTYGLTQHISVPTRSTRNTTSIIDHIYTNADKIVNSGVYTINISDHDIVFVTRRHTPSPKVPAQFIGRSYRNYDKAELKYRLMNEDWTNVRESNNPDHCWQIIYQKI